MGELPADSTAQMNATLGSIQELLKSLPVPGVFKELRAKDLGPPGTIRNKAAMESALINVAGMLAKASGMPEAKLAEMHKQHAPDPSGASSEPNAQRATPAAPFLPDALLSGNGGPPLPSAGSAPYMNDSALAERIAQILDLGRQEEWKGGLGELAKQISDPSMSSWPTEPLASLDLSRLTELIEEIAPMLSLGWAEASFEGQPVDAATSAARISNLARQLQEQVAALGHS